MAQKKLVKLTKKAGFKQGSLGKLHQIEWQWVKMVLKIYNYNKIT